jgi:hypothetical protein
MAGDIVLVVLVMWLGWVLLGPPPPRPPTVVVLSDPEPSTPA